ncbi:MAG TPA: carbamoyl-phosphate synthase large subunit [Clostridiales bacterium]|nr:carbamoyl-phosphate synthase large subunit [Clostridiales bacterium]
MPQNKEIKKVLVIGSGPIVIGQAAEFDYAGTQACRALKEKGLEVVLINPNPATIMTDNVIADKIYIEPLTTEVVKRIIKKEKPQGFLSTLGGQMGLTLGMQLAKEGFFEQENVKMLGASLDTIEKAEDRQSFKDCMEEIGQPVIPSLVVTDIEAAVGFAEEIGYPVIVRPAFTLGGSGGGMADDEAQLREITENGLRTSPIHQVLIEKSVAGWKEIEFEVMRDSNDNIVAVCSMENLDPVGVHTGDSIVIAPAVTLADKEYQMLRRAALNIVAALKVEGGCNCQFALDPGSFEYAVIEVNPRVSRSSALASKATGYPIARTAALIAIGFHLDEIQNEITGKTYASFEPTIDYVVVKMPRWPFDKFVYAKRSLGTQMKATGEVMAIAPTFEEALMKSVRGAEIGLKSLAMAKMEQLDDDELAKLATKATDERLFAIYEWIRRGVTIETIQERSRIDLWFLKKIENLVRMAQALQRETLDDGLYLAAKKMGFLDETIKELSGQEIAQPAKAVYKMVDTCAGEFAAETPYFYSTYDEENEAAEFIKEHDTGKKTIVVFGSGPIRIGQGIEFDYASVHCVWTLKEAGYEVVLVNNNPETVSTDFNTADRLYFEALTTEDVGHILDTEKPFGVVVAFGGQTAIKLTKYLADRGENILGTQADSIDIAEDRERFDEILEQYQIKRPKGETVMTAAEAVAAADRLGYPVLLRPSYVLGGQNMIIAFNEEDIGEYMAIILAQGIENPVLIDAYLMGVEVEVDIISDGEDILVPGIMEHIERAGVHSGDSIAVYPAFNLTGALTEQLVAASEKIAKGLKTKGLLNIQYVIFANEIYVIEANPRSSRTVPYISKVTGLPVVDIATRAMLGEKLKDMGYGTGLYRSVPYYAVKVPVFSFEKLADLDTQLGPEMKSTGEVLGIGRTLTEALYKGLVAANYRMEKGGGVFITVRNSDKGEMVDVARKFYESGFGLYATSGTAQALRNAGMEVSEVPKISEGAGLMELLEGGKINYVISTSKKGRLPARDSVKIRRKAVERAIPCLTSMDTANALIDSLNSRYSQQTMELVNINGLRREKRKVPFLKMRACNNDYLYFDCFDQEISAPESVSVALANRRTGIGSDGMILIGKSGTCDAKMTVYNADGTEGMIGGNALRCVAKYLYENDIVKKENMIIETASGSRQARLYPRDGEVDSVTVDMGKVVLEAKQVPTLIKPEKDNMVCGQKIVIDGKIYEVTCLSLGNPHCVVFLEDIHSLDLAQLGPAFENAPLFPERVNAEFVSVLAPNKLRMRVWERGNGETWSCGTGACAAAVAAVLNGYCKKDSDITVKLKGGDLVIRYQSDGTVLMTGDAKKDYEGVIEL